MFDRKHAKEMPLNGTPMRWEPSRAENASRSDFVTLTCPSCGGRLQITSDIDRFACAHCGNEHLVRREGGMIYLAPIAEDIRQIRGGVDKTAAELAVVRLAKDVHELERTFVTVSNRSDDDWLPPSLVEKTAPIASVVLPIVFFVVALALINASEGASNALPCIPFLAMPTSFAGSLIVWHKQKAKRLQAISQLKTIELSEVKASLLEKKGLLARNQAIVDA